MNENKCSKAQKQQLLINNQQFLYIIMNNFTQNLLCDLSNVVELSQDQKFQPRKLHCYKNVSNHFLLLYTIWTMDCQMQKMEKLSMLLLSKTEMLNMKPPTLKCSFLLIFWLRPSYYLSDSASKFLIQRNPKCRGWTCA